MNSFAEFYKENFWNNCTSFKGRLSRRKYIVGNLLMMLTTTPLILILVLLVSALGIESNTFSGMYTFIFVVFFISIISMSLSLTVRRLHDLNFSGLVMIVLMVPIVNIFPIVALMAMRGTVGTNKYGDDCLPADIGDSYVVDDAHTTMLKALPTYVFKNIYNASFTQDIFKHSGRSNRREYFTRCIGIFIAYQLLSLFILLAQLGLSFNIEEMSSTIPGNMIFALAFVLGLLTDIRRNHDRGRSGYYSLLLLIPIFNFAYIADQMSTLGDPIANKYGECTVTLDENNIPLDDF